MIENAGWRKNLGALRTACTFAQVDGCFLRDAVAVTALCILRKAEDKLQRLGRGSHGPPRPLQGTLDSGRC